MVLICSIKEQKRKDLEYIVKGVIKENQIKNNTTDKEDYNK
jgi:hypothetical protein